MKTLKKIAAIVFLQVFLFACTNESFINEDASAPEDTPIVNKSALTEPIVLGYFPSWSESWAAPGKGSKLRDIPEHITHVFLAFAKPNLRYVKGSLDISDTGIQTPYGGNTLKESVAALKTKGINVILSIGGETYWGTSDAYDINYQQIKDLVDDMGFEGIDWDYEPNGSFATIGHAENVQHFIDFFTNSRAIMPAGEYLLACAPAGVGALGGLNNDDSASPFSYANRNTASGESDANLHNATSPNQAISLFGFGATGHMIPVMKAVGDKIDLIAYQGYNTGAASNRKIMYDAYKHYANQYGFDIAAGVHYPNEPWGPYYEYNYQNVAELSAHIAANNSNDGIMIWQLLLGNSSTSAYGYMHVASQVLNGTSTSQAIANAENYPESPYDGGDTTNPPGGSGCESGQWNATSVYNTGQEVVHNNKLYRAKWWTQGDDPSTNSSDGQPWQYVEDCGGDTGGGNQLPTVSITAPSNNTSITQGNSISITANASDSDGTITKVEFYQGTTKLGEDTTSPYSYTWGNAAIGSYSITVKATDNENGSTTSTAISVNVTSGDTTGGSCNGIAAWEAYPQVYNQGDKVVYQNTIYEAQTGPIWVTPGSGEHWWKTIGTCSN